MHLFGFTQVYIYFKAAGCTALLSLERLINANLIHSQLLHRNAFISTVSFHSPTYERIRGRGSLSYLSFSASAFRPTLETKCAEHHHTLRNREKNRHEEGI